MRTPAVQFLLDDGQHVSVPVGGLIGRSEAASLRIVDPRVSEVHAMVALRGRELRLLSLRGYYTVDGHPDDDVPLAVGQRLLFGGAFGCVVSDVSVPARVLALEFADQLRELCAESYSFVARPTPELVPRFLADAAAWLWATELGWSLRVAGGAATALKPGRMWTIDGVNVSVREISLAETSGQATVGPREALRLVCRTTTVHIHRPRREPVTVDARAGQLLSELALMRVPVEWSVAARLLWPEEHDPGRLRRNFDAVLARLRARLREAGVREDLVRTDGRGNVEAFLERADEVVDEA